MPEATSRYLFCRLNLIVYPPDKMGLLKEASSDGRSIEGRMGADGERDLWSLIDCQSLEPQPEIGAVYTGFLTRYAPTSTIEVVEEEYQQLTNEAIRNHVIAKSRFFLHIGSGILAYHPVSGRIEPQAFRRRFAELLRRSPTLMVSHVSLDSIDQRFQIWEALTKMERVDMISVTLHPSNPRSDPIWESFDRRMKGLGVSSYHEVYRLNTDIDRITSDDEIRRKATMVDDGYGRATVVGTREGEKLRLTSDDNPISADASGDDEDPSGALEGLLEKFRALLARIGG